MLLKIHTDDHCNGFLPLVLIIRKFSKGKVEFPRGGVKIGEYKAINSLVEFENKNNSILYYGILFLCVFMLLYQGLQFSNFSKLKEYNKGLLKTSSIYFVVCISYIIISGYLTSFSLINNYLGPLKDKIFYLVLFILFRRFYLEGFIFMQF